MIVDTMDGEGRVIDSVYMHFLVNSTIMDDIDQLIVDAGITPIYDAIGNVTQLQFKSEQHRIVAIMKYGM